MKVKEIWQIVPPWVVRWLVPLVIGLIGFGLIASSIVEGVSRTLMRLVLGVLLLLVYAALRLAGYD